MNLFHRSRLLLASVAMTIAVGCASPGLPRAPSLHLPTAVTGLTASRQGDTVELRFTMPTRTTDGLPLRTRTLNGTLCRELASQPCTPVPAFASVRAVDLLGANGSPNVVTWRDVLPAPLASGEPRLLAYRVEFFAVSGRSGGKSDAAHTAAGQAPSAVEGLTAKGSRLGTILTWNALPTAASDVLVRREDVSPETAKPASSEASKTKAEPKLVWLLASSAAEGRSETLDTTATPDVPYSYIAVRRRSVQIGGRTLELRSAASSPVAFTLRDIYPPPTPVRLNAAGFTAAGTTQFAVDLIWQPVDDPRLAGYNIYRVSPEGTRQKLNSAPVTMPSFHDVTAVAGSHYRYDVTAIDAKGNESRPASTMLEAPQ